MNSAHDDDDTTTNGEKTVKVVLLYLVERYNTTYMVYISIYMNDDACGE